MLMDGDQVHSLPLRGASPGPGLQREALSPVCPGGHRVCGDRTPAASPKPSSQKPGSYCFSPFGCPARGRDTDRYLHWRHRSEAVCPRTAQDPHGSCQSRGPDNVGSCKCLPPCFLLSSPFCSSFFGCSLGL